MENFTMGDFINVICLRNQLLVVPEDEFVEKHKDEDQFLSFLDTFAVLTEIDSAFLLFSDDIISKIEAVITDNRFRYKERSIIEAINQVIYYVNGVKNYDESSKELLKKSYLEFHEDCRKGTIEDDDFFLKLLAYDAIVYFALAEDRMDLVENADICFLSSINYFIEAIPELFDNAAIKIRATNKIEEIAKKGWPFKRVNRNYSIETKENLQKIKVKGE